MEHQNGNVGCLGSHEVRIMDSKTWYMMEAYLNVNHRS